MQIIEDIVSNYRNARNNTHLAKYSRYIPKKCTQSKPIANLHAYSLRVDSEKKLNL